jgi:hypothetical protein
MAGIVLKGAALTKALKSELVSILKECYRELTSVGDTVKSELIDGVFETVATELGDDSRWHQYRHVVTKTPDGRLFEWTWQYGSGDTDHIGPAEYSDPELREVRKTTRTVVITEYVSADSENDSPYEDD